MVKKAKWLKNVKKAFSPDLKKLKHKSVEYQNSEISYPVLVASSRSSPPQFEVRVDKVNVKNKKKLYAAAAPPPPPPPEEEEEEDVLVDSPPSSPEFVPPAAKPDRFPGKSKEDAAAILIQSTFRGHLARRETQGMRRLARLNLMMEGSFVQRQAAHTLKCMQTLTRVQSQIRSRRIRMSEENQARHKQLLHKHAKELGGLKNGGNWNVSNQSKEQIEAGLLNKYEAAMRREKALAYAFTHQQNLKGNMRSANTMFMDTSNPTWGWSWLERWMADKPWESSEKEQSKNEKSTVKTLTNRHSHVVVETTKPASTRKKLNSSTQPNIPSSSSSSSTRKPRKTPTQPSIKSKTTDEITKNSEKNRKHSIARSAVSDDEGLASSTTRRRNMVPTKPTRSGKLKGQSSSGVAAAATTTANTEEKNGVLPERAEAKKRASIAPKARRSSATPKVENSILKKVRTPSD